MKYPKKNKPLIAAPFLGNDEKYYFGFLNKDGTIERTSLTFYHEFDHALVPCMAYNKRFGYDKKEVLKIIKKVYNAEKQKDYEKQKKVSR